SDHTDIGATAFTAVLNILNIYRRVVEPIEEQVRIRCAAHIRLENKDARTRLINVTYVKRIDYPGPIEANIAQRRMTRTLDLNRGSRSAAGIHQNRRKHAVAHELHITVGRNSNGIGEIVCALRNVDDGALAIVLRHGKIDRLLNLYVARADCYFDD